ncbi:hypothetical protein DRJ25_04910, partial [Candidatus Woesearchaeota archaeon]
SWVFLLVSIGSIFSGSGRLFFRVSHEIFCCQQMIYLYQVYCLICLLFFRTKPFKVSQVKSTLVCLCCQAQSSVDFL